MSKDIFSRLHFEELTLDKKKSSRRKLQIADETIEMIYKDGIENITYENLSKRCNIVRGVIYSYFPTITDLLVFTCLLICYRYQSSVVKSMESKKQSSSDILKAYVESSLTWAEDAPKDFAAQLIFFYRCHISIKLAKINQQMVDMGTERISNILKVGIESKDFKIPVSDAAKVARQIQLIITGAIVSNSTEVRSKEDWHLERQMLTQLCLKLAASKTT